MTTLPSNCNNSIKSSTVDAKEFKLLPSDIMNLFEHEVD